MESASQISTQTLAEEMYAMVKECTGKRKLNAGDLTKAMIARYGETMCGKEECKKAIRSLIDSGLCIYTYFGGSYIELPSEADEGTVP